MNWPFEKQAIIGRSHQIEVGFLTFQMSEDPPFKRRRTHG